MNAIDEEKNDTSLKLFEDIYHLERNYKFNLLSLKIKEDELQRCKASNDTLKESVKNNLTEIGKLKSQVLILEESLRACEEERANEKQLCEDILNKLTGKLGEARTKYKTELEEREDEMKRRLNELETLHKRNLNENDCKHRRRVAELEDNLESVTAMAEQMKEQVGDLIEENMSLKNQKRDLENRIMPEIAMYQNELKAVKNSNQNLHSQLGYIQTAQKRRNAHFEKLKKENVYLKSHLKEIVAQLDVLTQQNTDRTKENILLSQTLQQNYHINAELLNQCKRLEDEKMQLQKELDRLGGSGVCMFPKHSQFEELQKQNELLQSIIKSMKKEKDVIVYQGRKGIEETEQRVERLEVLIEELKAVMFKSSN